MPLPLLKKQFKFCYLSAVLSTIASAKVESLLKADVILLSRSVLRSTSRKCEGGLIFNFSSSDSRPVTKLPLVAQRRSPSDATLAKNRGPNTQNPSFKKPCFLKHYISIYAYTNILSAAAAFCIFNSLRLRRLCG